jgi:hypothetical protein
MPLPTEPLESGRLTAGSAALRPLAADDPVTRRVLDVAAGLDELLAEAATARTARAEEGSDGAAVCAWNHFENIPTFYNWNNRPR